MRKDTMKNTQKPFIIPPLVMTPFNIWYFSFQFIFNIHIHFPFLF